MGGISRLFFLIGNYATNFEREYYPEIDLHLLNDLPLKAKKMKTDLKNTFHHL